jgi:pimeloyl-ACP methyl ester carboxylesterase
MSKITTLQGLVLEQLFVAMNILAKSTILRLFLALYLMPVYCFTKAFSVLPSVIRQCPLLVTGRGREKLITRADVYRRCEQDIAAKQHDGTYRFSPASVLWWDGRTSWDMNRLVVEVCGINARVVHAKPKMIAPTSTSPKLKSLILLHGNPSWSYIWRDIIPDLTTAGYEVFAIDWLGHGTSDKPLHISEISFELHMHTLRRVIEQLDLAEFYIAAHDWGGCIALCTIPTLPAERHCKGLFLLNTFLPPRPHDISLHYYLLYWIWFFSTGICGPLLPDSFVLRFMAPNMSVKASEVYSQPYAQSLFNTKTSISRFSHIVPGLPDCIYDLRQTCMWRTIEGLLGPEHFTNLTAQAWLANRDQEVREWWSSSSLGNDKGAAARAPESVMILFGRDDPLLPEFKNVLERSIRVSSVLQGGEAGWLPGAGHYPMEQKPKEIAHCLVQLLEWQ